MIPFKVEAPKITPSMQNEMRSTKRSTLKRGRKKGSKGKKTGDKTLARKRSKRDILKAASPTKKTNEGEGKRTKRSKKTADGADADALAETKRVKREKPAKTALGEGKGKDICTQKQRIHTRDTTNWW